MKIKRILLIAPATEFGVYPPLGLIAIASFIRKEGYEVVRQRGSHMRLSCHGRKSVTVPDYKTVSLGLLAKILRDAQISHGAFLDLCRK